LYYGMFAGAVQPLYRGSASTGQLHFFGFPLVILILILILPRLFRTRLR